MPKGRRPCVAVSLTHQDKDKTFKGGNKYLDIGAGWLRKDFGERYAGSFKVSDNVQLLVGGKPVDLDNFFVNMTVWPEELAAQISDDEEKDDF